jgi:hypothetical protein
MAVPCGRTQLPDMSNSLAAGAAADVWRRTLGQIPTHFGRLVFVAGLRDANGRYAYRPLTDSMGREITDRTLANSHYSVFSEWIASSLSAQKADLDHYLCQRGGARELADYRELVPAKAHEVERQLYLTDLETLLTMLRFEPDGALSILRA